MMGKTIIYLDDSFNIVDRDRATIGIIIQDGNKSFVSLTTDEKKNNSRNKAVTEIRELKFTQVEVAYMGGEHSGHHGHAGRPGRVGGSAPSSKVSNFGITSEEAGTVAAWEKAFNEPIPASDDDHYYHATILSNLDKIRSEGLKPTNDPKFPSFARGNRVSLAPNIDDTIYWSTRIMWSTWDKKGGLDVGDKPIFLRMSKMSVPDAYQFRMDEVRTFGVEKNALEVWRGGKWSSL